MIKWDNGVDISCITASHVVEILRAVPDYVDETVRNSFFRVADIVEKYGLDSFVANPREFLCNRHRIHIVVSSDNRDFLVSVGDENPVYVPVLSICPTFKRFLEPDTTKDVPKGCVMLPKDKNGKYINPDDRPILKWNDEGDDVGSYMFLTDMTYFGTDPDGNPIWTGDGDDEDDFSDNLEGSEIVGTYRTNGVTKDIMGLLIEAVHEHDTEKTLLYAKIIADQHTEI